MATTTPVLKLVKPAIHGEETDNVWGYDLNANFDKIDAAVSALGGAVVSIGDTPPASPVHGQLFWESDTGGLYVFYNDGNSQQWVQVNSVTPVSGVGPGPGPGPGPEAPVNTVAPSVTGTLMVGQILTVSNGSWTNIPTAYAYQWFRSGGSIVGAIAQTYVPVEADVGAALYCEVTATNSGGSTLAQSNVTGAISPVPVSVPSNTTPPAITGTETEGQTLTVSNGTWTNSPTAYAYQWSSAAGAIVGATAATYLLKPADVGAVLHCKVTATNASGSTTVQSNSTGVIGAIVDTTPDAFTFTDVTGAAPATVYTSNAITVAGINAPAPISIVGGTYAINGGAYTGAAGTVVLGDSVTVRVTSASANGTGVNAALTIGGVLDTYTVTTAAAGAPSNTARPTITGNQTVGFTLTVSTGIWTGGPTGYTYQWFRGSTAISGATAMTYLQQAADAGAILHCKVTATNASGSTTAQSESTGVIAPEVEAAPVNTVLPEVTGSPIKGQTLTVSDGTWTGNPTSYMYQWFSGTNFVSTASTYVIQQFDVNKLIHCDVLATNSGGSTTASSNSVGPVTATL